MSEQGILSYPEPGGEEFTAGHSGTDTSKERAVDEARSGTVKQRQDRTLSVADSFAGYGITVKELRDMTGLHHGQASSALSNLHKAGLLARLQATRQGCKVYVLPEYVNDRDTETFGRSKPAPKLDRTDKEVEAIGRLRFALRHSFGSQTYVPTDELATVIELLERQARG